MSLRPIKSSRRRSRRTFTQLRAERTWKAWKGWNAYPKKPSDVLNLFGNKRFVLGIVALIVILGGILLAQGPLFHGTYPPFLGDPFKDPVTTIWKITAPNNDLSELNSIDASFGVTGPTIVLNPDGTNTAVALTKSSVGDLGIAAAKQMFYRAQYQVFTSGTGSHITNDFGFYLTTNKTVPTTPNVYVQQDSATAQTFSLNLRSDINGQISKDGTVFTSATPFNIAKVFFNLKRIGNPSGNIYAEIYTINGVLPNGVPNTLQATSNAISASSISSSSVTFAAFTFPEPFFIQGNPTQYFVVIDASQVTTDASDYLTTYLQNIVGTKNKADFTVGGTWTADNLHSLNYAVDGGYYDPEYDPSVAMLVRIVPLGGANFYNELLMQRTIGDTIASESVPACSPSGSCFVNPTDTIDPTTTKVAIGGVLNYTTQGGLTNTCTGSTGGPGCSELAIGPGTAVPPTVNAWSQEIPWFRIQAEQYYAGFYSLAQNGITGQGDVVLFYFESTGASFNPNDIVYYVPGPNCPGQANGPCNPDTGGFFGSLLKGLISMVVFIFNALLLFVSFITPALKTALGFLESIVQDTLNIIGNAVGLGNLGDDLFSLINTIILFFTDTTKGLPAAFGQLSATVLDWFKANSIYFQWVPTMISIALNVLTFAINGIAFALTIIGFMFKLIVASYVTVLILFYFIYVADDSLGGVLAFFETGEWLIFGLGLKYLIKLVNFGLDILALVIGHIPKPFIQMTADKIPRIPFIETSARFVTPSLDLGELRSGNLMSVFFLMVGMLFLTMYETATPALPGSLAATVPGVAGSMATLAGTIPLLETLVGIVGGLTFLVWPFAKGFQLIGFDVGMEHIPVAPGRHISSGPGGISVKAAGKRFGKKTKTTTQKELESLQKQKAETTTVAEVKEVQRREEEIRQRELASRARGKDLKGPKLGPLGPEDES